jgi:hypothetical protein
LFPFYHSRFSEKHSCSVERMISLRLACMFTLIGKASRLTCARLRRLDSLITFSSVARRELVAKPVEIDFNSLTEVRFGRPGRAAREMSRARYVCHRTTSVSYDRAEIFRRKWGSKVFRGVF